ncbi:MAG: arylsulfatase [Xanthomonadales bacterium]|jgi:arylsulfatase|nr:arylsulfatase [Xanthomonadales bacterium]
MAPGAVDRQRATRPGAARFRVPVLLCALLACTARAEDSRHAAQQASPPPSFLVILADDLGYSDPGFMGSEIRTPQLDALAASGLVLTDFQVSPACSPTRAMLLSGAPAHASGFGTMWDEASPEQQGRPGYEGQLSDRVVTLAELLRDAGYFTALSGKWHLGRGPGRRPVDRGFERAFGPVHGGATHFADRLALFSAGGPPGPAGFEEDGEPIGDLPDDWYSSTGFTDKLIEQIEGGTGTDGMRPFFALAAYTAPHWPLQAPPDFIDRYAGVYDDGWDALRADRVAALQERGIVPKPLRDERLPFVRAWSDLAPEERRRQARIMEVYAAMVEQLDHEVGRLLAWLESTGRRDNTWVLFLSDNGAEGNPVNRIVADHGWVERTFDNRLGNIGRPGSYVFSGPGWAQASTAPFRLFKTFPTEGGTRTPAVIAGPGVKPGGFDDPRSRALVTIRDVLPTLLELAGVAHPASNDPSWQGAAPTGTSLVSLLDGSAEQVHGPAASQVFELFGRRSVRRGHWKALWLYEPYGRGRWALFDLARDPGERDDLSARHPDVLAALVADFDTYAARHGVILPAQDAGYAMEDDWTLADDGSP